MSQDLAKLSIERCQCRLQDVEIQEILNKFDT